jgi:translocation and assembly module TamA
VDERFYLGGRDTLRGFIERNLLPEDACVVPAGAGQSRPPGCVDVIRVGVDEQGRLVPPVSQGGDFMLLGKAELRTPVAGELALGMFVDAGNLWSEGPSITDLRLRVGTGLGLRYGTPVGALALDVGVNPWARASFAEPRLQVHFSVGLF